MQSSFSPTFCFIDLLWEPHQSESEVSAAAPGGTRRGTAQMKASFCQAPVAAAVGIHSALQRLFGLDLFSIYARRGGGGSSPLPREKLNVFTRLMLLMDGERPHSVRGVR